MIFGFRVTGSVNQLSPGKLKSPATMMVEFLICSARLMDASNSSKLVLFDTLGGQYAHIWVERFPF